MDLSSSVQGLVIALVFLLPLAWKWQIDMQVAVLAALLIGFASGLVVQAAGITPREGLVFMIFTQAVFILGVTAALLLWRFYRDPERRPSRTENVILSPADGRVLYVKRTETGEVPFSEKGGRKYYLHEFFQSDALPVPGTLIGIAMNFLDVHVNRSPVRGRIELIKHIDGSFLSLGIPEALIRNERQFTLIDNGGFQVGVVQIASRLVRNIVSYKKAGEDVAIGERIGMIRFGSQVDLYIPDGPEVRIEAKKDQKVKAGLTVIATYGSAEN